MSLDEHAERELANVTSLPTRITVPAVRFVSAGSLLSQPAPTEWLVRDTIERGTLVTCIGAPASFKSAMMLDVAACAACGTDWHGKTVKQGAVFYLAGEGHRGIARRLKAWQIVRQAELAGAPLFVSTGAVSLVEPLNAADVSVEVQRIAEQHGVKPELVVIDTLARNLGPADENSASDMGQFITNVDTHIRQCFDSTVIVVHHTGVMDSGRGRGSSSLKAAVDVEIISERTDRTVTLRCSKSKDAAEFAPLSFESRIVELPWFDADGRPETSFVMHPLDMQETADRIVGLGGNQRKALDTLRKLYENARANLSAAGHSPDGALVSLNEWRAATGLERNRFSETVTALRTRSLIEVETPHVRIR